MTPSHLLRSLRRSRSVVFTAIATLAVGVGALTITLGIADAALWRQPPFRGAERVVVMLGTTQAPNEPLRTQRWSWPRIQRLRQDLRSVEHLASVTPVTGNLTGTDLTEPLTGEIVSPEFFPVLGAAAFMGRTFAADEDRASGAHPLVVVSHDLWQRRFGGDAAVVGKTLAVNRQALTIIGVMPPGFRGLSDVAEFWVPSTMAPLLSYPEYLTTDQNFITVLARLATDRSMAQVRAELSTVGPAVVRALPSADDEEGAFGATAVPLAEARIAPEVHRAAWLLLGSVVLLHLLACANAVTLLMGRAVTQRREAAVRATLGGTTAALYRRYVGDGATITSMGCLAGLLLAWWGRGLHVPLNRWGPRNFYGSVATFADPAFGWRTFVAWLAVSAATLALVSWAPALAVVRGDLARHLKEGARAAQAAGLSLRRVSAQGLIIALEAALAATLLVVGALMVESFDRMREAPIGVRAERVLTFTLRPSEASVPVNAGPAFVERMLAAIASVPGVRSASVDGGAPLSGSASSTLRIVGQPAPPPGREPPVLRHYVGPDHFTTLGIPLIRGRAFTDRDRAGQAHVAIISETAARTFWPGGDALGQRVWFGGGSTYDRPDSSAEIVGIVGDVAYQPLDRAANAASFYTPYRQFTYGWRTYFVRTAGDPLAMVGAIREAVYRVDPDVPLTEVRTMTDLLQGSWARSRFDAQFFALFAGFALVLAASGIYAVVAHAVGERRREMAIRLAVGSSPRGLLGLIVREGMSWPLAGLVMGVSAAVAGAGVLRGALYGVSPSDPRVLLVAVLSLGLVAAVACVIPARRAMRVDPQEALRE
ncbi:MAG: ABC transporter permease [Gemmatimonadaceae bacterium]|nr:ABC transporter permease [Gemmatimonadaceae bacterium]